MCAQYSPIQAEEKMKNRSFASRRSKGTVSEAEVLRYTL
jgi:hypothetical protein